MKNIGRKNRNSKNNLTTLVVLASGNDIPRSKVLLVLL